MTSSAETSGSVVVGNVRVQVLASTLVRLEVKGPEGFEDRNTYYIASRAFAGVPYTVETTTGGTLVKTADYTVKVPSNASSLSGITIADANGKQLWAYSTLPTERAFLPGASEKPKAWAIADNPRMVPASWGYSVNASAGANNGWDLANNAPDMYVFLPKGDGMQLRNDYLTLTGRASMLPLSAMGFWDSRWYPYTEQTALQQVSDYRSHDIPLDNLVIDTNWRTSGSTGYDVATNDFPDITRFFSEAHAANVNLMFNDHPQPVTNPDNSLAGALDANEVAFRNTGLLSLLSKGLDTWWFDRNWSVALTTPSAGVNKETWGMYVFQWITSHFNPTRRAMIMANVDGVDNGQLNNPPSIASHRYTFQWTGDITPGNDSLKREIYNALYEGMYAANPYVSADLGGHVGDPTSEGYIRWLQYGTFSPITRVHCSWGMQRMPWAFGEQAESITRDFVKMRYRLLPVYYSLARESYDTGTPMLRRCDYAYPDSTEAKSDDQYLVGDSILAAPIIYNTSDPQTVPSAWLKTPDGQPGLKAEYFANNSLSGSPVLTRTDSNLNFNWGGGSPDSSVPADQFSVRWTGTITVGDYDAHLSLKVDDGVRVYIDDALALNEWGPHDSTTLDVGVRLAAGSTHSIRVEYFEGAGNAVCSMTWQPYSIAAAQRTVWVPQGSWVNVWTGELVNGPRTITVTSPIEQMPLFVKAGSVLPLAPDMSYTGEKPWSPVTLDVYPSAANAATGRLYEDDTKSTSYENGDYRTTALHATSDSTAKQVTVKIDAAKGSYSGALSSRKWSLRLHKTAEWMNAVPSSVTIDGAPTTFTVAQKDASASPFAVDGSSPDGDVTVVNIPESSVSTAHTVVVTYTVGSVLADKTALQKQIAVAAQKVRDASLLSSSSLSALQTALNAANDANAQTNPTQQIVNDTLQNLNSVLSSAITVKTLTRDEYRGVVDLTNEGSIAWAQYGLNDTKSYDRKAGSTQIGPLSAVGNSSDSVRLLLSDSQIRTSWSDGTPTPNADNVAKAVFTVGNGNGSQFSVHIDRPCRLKVYTTTWAGTGKFEVVSSDGSTPIAETFSSGDASNGYTCWTVDFLPYNGFKAQDVTVRYVTVGTQNVSIESATLAAIDNPVVSIDPIPAVIVQGGTSKADALAKLPETGTIKDKAGNSYTVAISWALSAYDSSRSGDYPATGSFTLPAGVDAASSPLQATATVTVNNAIVSVAPASDITVTGGTAKADAIAKLPATTTVKDQAGNTHTVALTWAIAGYDAGKSGGYAATGSFTLPVGVVQSTPATPLHITATVTVNNAIVSVAPVDAVTAPYGTSLDDAIAKLPDTTTVKDQAGNSHTVALTWTIAGYDAGKPNAYTATGSFTLPTGVVQSSPAMPLTVNAAVTVTAAPSSQSAPAGSSGSPSAAPGTSSGTAASSGRIPSAGTGGEAVPLGVLAVLAASAYASLLVLKRRGR